MSSNGQTIDANNLEATIVVDDSSAPNDSTMEVEPKIPPTNSAKPEGFAKFISELLTLTKAYPFHKLLSEYYKSHENDKTFKVGGALWTVSIVFDKICTIGLVVIIFIALIGSLIILFDTVGLINKKDLFPIIITAIPWTICVLKPDGKDNDFCKPLIQSTQSKSTSSSSSNSSNTSQPTPNPKGYKYNTITIPILTPIE